MPQVKDRSVYVSTRWSGFHERYPTNSATMSNMQVLKLVRTRTGDVNPHWRQDIREQRNATTNMTGIYDTYESAQASGWVKFTYPDANNGPIFKNVTWGDILAAATVPSTTFSSWTVSPLSSVAYNRAVISFLKNVRGAQVMFSAPTFLGELRESLHMIRHPANDLGKRVSDYFKRLKKHKKQKPKTWLKDLSQLWLEQAFGWVPLISDINRAYKALESLNDDRKQIPVRGVGIVTTEWPSKRKTAYLFKPDPSSVAWRFSQRGFENHVVVFKGMVKRQVDSRKVDGWSTFGFEPTEFIPTAWELLPWSFLIDYFSNIGDVITAGCAVRSSIAWSNMTSIRSLHLEAAGGHSATDTDGTFPGYRASDGSPLYSKQVRRYVQRTANATIGTPELAFEVPGLARQWANMSALFIQAHSGLHPQRFPKSGLRW